VAPNLLKHLASLLTLILFCPHIQAMAKPRVSFVLEAYVSVKKQKSNSSDEEVICEKAIGKHKL